MNWLALIACRRSLSSIGMSKVEVSFILFYFILFYFILFYFLKNFKNLLLVGFEVQAMGQSLKCRPDPKQTNPVTGKVIPPEHLPTHRFPSTATPSFYVPLPAIKTEDDVIYRPNFRRKLRISFC